MRLILSFAYTVYAVYSGYCNNVYKMYFYNLEKLHFNNIYINCLLIYVNK